MAYKKGGGAAAVAGYEASTRDVTAIEKMWQGIESLWSSAQDVGAAISLTTGEADTAWKEYEAGYEAMGGEDFKRPEWGDKGYFKSLFSGPEGDVRIGASMYDREKIRNVGTFLDSDVSTALLAGETEGDIRDKYLKRIAPGRDMTAEEISTTRKSLRPKMPFTGGKYDVDEEFSYDAWTAESPVYQPKEHGGPIKYMEPGLSEVGQGWETPQGGSYQRWKADQSALGTTVAPPEDMSGINKSIQSNVRFQDYRQRLDESERFRVNSKLNPYNTLQQVYEDQY